MIEKPYCKENIAECPCARCVNDKDNCCGCALSTTYTCPVRRCSEFKERKPEPPKKPDKERGS